MRIAYLSSSIIPSRTANSIHVMKMCQAFAKNGHEVMLFARRAKEKFEDDFTYYGVEPVFNIERQNWPGIRGLGGFIYAKQIKRKLNAGNNYDLLYGRDIYSLLLCSGLKIPLIYEAHTPPENRVRILLEKRLFQSKNFKHLVVISNALKNEYLRLFPELEKIVTAHDGADLPVNDKIPVKHLNGGRIKVGYIGHLYPGKGMEVIAQLAEHLSDIDFHIIGGTDKDINYWKEQVNSKNMIFYGFVPHGKLSDYYNSFDILLAPYQNKVQASGGGGDISKWMSPLKIFEYMSYGKAMIVSDLPVLREVLKHNLNCKLCGADNIEGWKFSLLKLANHPEERRKIGKCAYMDFVANYTWQKRGEKVLV